MSEQSVATASATQVQSLAESLPSSARLAILAGAWLVLTALFLFASVVLIGSVVTALGQSLRVLASLIALVGVLAACGVSPTLAWVVVARAVERYEDAVDREVDAAPDEWQLSLVETNERERCRNPCICCN